MHRHWRPADAAYLENGSQELALFVGDLGDEDCELVERVARVRAPKAVILGNHDAWQSFSRRKPTNRLLRSLAALQGDHLAYEVREVPSAGISIVGARPFSWGGPSLRSPEVYNALYKVHDAKGSADRIYEAARRAQHRDLMILAHNGPTGLSRDPADIYGKDFGRQVGGDWGDEDLEMALRRIEASGWRVRCVIAGHMHHTVLSPPGALRERFIRRGATLFVNPAVVPRVRTTESGESVGHFLRTEWSGGFLRQVDEIWVDSTGRIVEVDRPMVRELLA